MKLLFPKGIGSSGSFQPFSWWGDAAIPGDAGVGPPLAVPLLPKEPGSDQVFFSTHSPGLHSTMPLS